MGAAVAASSPACERLLRALRRIGDRGKARFQRLAAGSDPAYWARPARLVSTPSNSEVSSLSICPAIVVSTSW